LVQLDDLKSLDRLRPAAFLIHATSPNNYQAWITVSDAPKGKEQFKEFVRRIRKAIGENDKSASHATRIAGSENFKLAYSPSFPIVTIDQAVRGRILTSAQLQEMGLLAAPEPVKPPSSPPRVSGTQYSRQWPSYEISLMRAKKRKDGMPDRSDADFKWYLTALTGGKTVEDTKAKLLEVSERAKERRARDPGYIEVTVENAARIVEQNYGKGRA
jgi:RepB DNA-primase from phage plasmid